MSNPLLFSFTPLEIYPPQANSVAPTLSYTHTHITHMHSHTYSSRRKPGNVAKTPHYGNIYNILDYC